jgi:hypothetical protein
VGQVSRSSQLSNSACTSAAYWVALALPFEPDRVERYWTRVKLVYGVAWLAICAWVFFTGQSDGLLLALDRDARFG